MNRKKAAAAVIAAVLSVAVLCGVLAGCTTGGDPADNLGTNFTPYDEELFVAQMAEKGENKTAFAVNGVCLYPEIVYPGRLFEENGRGALEFKGAMEYLRDALTDITGTQMALTESASYTGGKAIVFTLDESLSLSRDGYLLEISDDKIAFTATTAEALASAAYAFLEEELGCMFAASDYDYIPPLEDIYLEKQSRTVEPSVEWRYVYNYESFIPVSEDGDRTEYGSARYSKLRLNGTGNNDWYRWVHTAFTYISPEEYYDEHPEYFSLCNGRRVYEQGPVSGQLCWSNEDVYRIIYEKVTAEMRANPDTHIWSISQMDTWINRGVGCECDECKAIDEREGSQMGSLLTFINRLAEDIEKEFPDNYIATLAYNYTAEPPANLRPRDNVIIQLCLMPGDSASSYADPKSGAAQDAHDLVAAWGKVAKHVVIWDYNIDFHNYMMPYPILDYLEENNDFYIENNVYGMFHQMDADKGGDFAELNSYIFAQLMWNKDIDVQATFNKFLTVYYGAAAPYIAEYYGLLSSNVEKSGVELYLYASPLRYSTSYLSPAALDDYLEIFEKAERAVEGDETLLNRVHMAEKSVLFAKAAQFSPDMGGRRDALEKFMDICEANGITSLMEGEGNGDEMANFYNAKKAEITAMPAIIIAMILGAALFAAAITAIIISIYCKVKYGTFLIWKVVAKKRAANAA